MIKFHTTDLSRLPDLPVGFADRFTSQMVDTGEVRLHAVTGGRGEPLLLVGGWPQTWFAWRHVMTRLADEFAVVAVDSRGVGWSERPETGYDSTTLAGDLAALMSALGHERFGLVGHDVGMWTSYALATNRPDRVTKLVVAEATIPGLSVSPPLLGPKPLNDFLWHFAFNRSGDIAVQMVEGREALYFGHQFASKAARPDALPADVVDLYVDALRAPGALRASFAFYAAIDENIAQTLIRKARPLTMPVLALGGAKACMGRVAADMELVAPKLQSLIIDDCGHFMPEEAPDAMSRAIAAFFREAAENG